MFQEIQEIEESVYTRPPQPEARLRQTTEAFTISLCEEAEAFRDLREEWNHLLDRASRKSAFLRHEFMYAWWETYGRRQHGATPFILMARDRERRLAGLLPLYREKSSWSVAGLRELRFLGSVHEAPEYLDVIVAGNMPTEKIIDAVLTGLAQLRAKYDLLRLTDMAEDALLLPFLRHWATACGGAFQQMPWKVCPYIKISGDFETYLQGLSSNHRANFRRRQRKLNESHKVTMDVATAPIPVEKDFEALFDLHQKRWTEREGTSAFDNETSRLFHRRVAGTMAASGVARIFSLQCDGQIVAALYCFLYDNRLMYYQAGFDVNYESKSVGLILMGMVLQHCFEQGYAEFYFLRGREEYKFHMYALRFLGTVHEAPEYLDVMVAGSAPAHKIIKALLAGLANLRNNYDLLRLFDMADDAVLLAFLPEWAEACGSRLQQRPWMICPHLKISGDFETYLQTLSAKHSANFRRQLRKLKERYAVTLEVASALSPVERDFAALCELHHQRWAQRHETSDFDNDMSRRFHGRVVKALASSGAVRIFSLQCDGKTVAALYCLFYDDRLMYYQAGFDVAYENQSVGLVLLGMVLQHSHEQGYGEFDFLRGEEEYKFRWTKTTRATVIGEIAVTGRAKIYLNGWDALRFLKKQACGLFNHQRQPEKSKTNTL